MFANFQIQTTRLELKQALSKIKTINFSVSQFNNSSIIIQFGVFWLNRYNNTNFTLIRKSEKKIISPQYQKANAFE